MSNIDMLDDIPDEIDFSEGIPNKFAERYSEGTNIVAVDPEVLDVFPDSESVNAALRSLAEIIRAHGKPTAG